MIFTAQDRKPKRILEFGCYSGYSALAWYEGTKTTGAEIITLELSQVMIDASRKIFDKYNVNDRIKLIEGPADNSLDTLTGTFDIIFMDANKDGYEGYVKKILDKKLLSADGIILCDNGKTQATQIKSQTNQSISPSFRSRSHYRQRCQSPPEQCSTTLLEQLRQSPCSIQPFRCK